MTEKIVMDGLMLVAAVIAGASVINQMTPDADRHPQFAKWIDYLSMNVRKAQNNPHSHPWTTLLMKACDTPVECGEDCPGEPTCGFVHRQENSWEKTWQCNCGETPCLRRLPDEERPNRRAAIEATKRKREARNALVG